MVERHSVALAAVAPVENDVLHVVSPVAGKFADVQCVPSCGKARGLQPVECGQNHAGSVGVVDYGVFFIDFSIVDHCDAIVGNGIFCAGVEQIDAVLVGHRHVNIEWWDIPDDCVWLVVVVAT